MNRLKEALKFVELIFRLGIFLPTFTNMDRAFVRWSIYVKEMLWGVFI